MSVEQSVEICTGREYYERLKRSRQGYLYKHLFGCEPEESHTVCIVLYDEDGEIGGYYVFIDGKGNKKIV